MKDEKEIVHKTQKEIEEEHEQTLEEFMHAKVFNEDSPMPFTNKIVIEQIIKELKVKDPKNVYDPKGFVGTAVVMHQTKYEEYRKYMEKAGYKYDNSL